MNTKTVTLTFEVPADLDTPSEVLAKMKQLLLAAMEVATVRAFCHPVFSDEERALCKALLTVV